jgi:hypothetical protein
MCGQFMEDSAAVHSSLSVYELSYFAMRYELNYLAENICYSNITTLRFAQTHFFRM